MKLIVIDMQKALVCEDLYESNKLLNNVVKLVKTARKNNIEVIYIQHDAGEGSGFSRGDESFEITDQLKPENNEKVFVKTINSAFGNSGFSDYLKQSQDKDLMIVGLQTEYCIDATIKSAFEKGYHVIVPKGANSTFDNEYLDAKKAIKYYNEWIWPGSFAECVSFAKALKLLGGN